MTVTNIIDRRKRPYRFRKINAIVEATAHDNSIADADESHGGGPWYDEREHLSLTDAILWAQAFGGEVTLFLYDEDGGIYDFRISDELDRPQHGQSLPSPELEA